LSSRNNPGEYQGAFNKENLKKFAAEIDLLDQRKFDDAWTQTIATSHRSNSFLQQLGLQALPVSSSMINLDRRSTL
jgi:hypothetical protein